MENKKNDKQIAFDNLSKLLALEKKADHGLVPFMDFFAKHKSNPEPVLRDIFRIMYDLVFTAVGEGEDEYPGDPQSINYLRYDRMGDLLERGADHPFFADRLFANRFMNFIVSLKRGLQQNKIFVFIGPHGCGKSTFLINLLKKLEEYTYTPEGACYQVVWRLNREKIMRLRGVSPQNSKEHLMLNSIMNALKTEAKDALVGDSEGNILDLPSLDLVCPAHDHPITMIPKDYRSQFLSDWVAGGKSLERILRKNRFKWVLENSCCAVCTALYKVLMSVYDNPGDIFSETLFVTRYLFSDMLGQGISIFSPGDLEPKDQIITDSILQNQLDRMFGARVVEYIYSRLAKTNNGVYALMDIMDHNKSRLENLHQYASEGFGKVNGLKQYVETLFLVAMNPEDREAIQAMSFEDRIEEIRVNYVLDYNTLIEILKNIFGEQIEEHFLPEVLKCFAKLIIATRINISEAMGRWIENPGKYGLYCDNNLFLLKMDIYTGIIPEWLNEKDRAALTSEVRKAIILESETEGQKGLSSRDCHKIFQLLYEFSNDGRAITMEMLSNFVKSSPRAQLIKDMVPKGFFNALQRSYDYSVLQKVKEAAYWYNEAGIIRGLLNYLFAVGQDIDTTVKCLWTGEKVEVTKEFLFVMGTFLEDEDTEMTEGFALVKAQQISRRFNTVYAQELAGPMSDSERVGLIKKTDFFEVLKERYMKNLKSKTLDPFVENENFRNAIKDFGKEAFRNYDRRIREYVSHMIDVLCRRGYGYNKKTAKEVCMYVLDNDLVKKFKT